MGSSMGAGTEGGMSERMGSSMGAPPPPPPIFSDQDPSNSIPFQPLGVGRGTELGLGCGTGIGFEAGNKVGLNDATEIGVPLSTDLSKVSKKREFSIDLSDESENNEEKYETLVTFTQEVRNIIHSDKKRVVKPRNRF